MAVALLLATVFVGAVEAQTVAQTLYTDTTPVDTFLAAHPGSSISSIDQNGVTVQTTKGKARILSPGLTYQNGSTWAITKAQVNLLASSAGWSLTGTPVPISISGSGSSMHVTVGSGTKTLDWRLSSIAYASAKGFTFQSGGLAWTLNLTNSGMSLQSQVTAKKGAQTFSFPYTFTAGTVSVDSKGNLDFGTVFSTSHPTIIGADYKAYPCSAWSVANSVASFSCDDTALPAAAYPYTIDPTTATFGTASSTCSYVDNGTYCIFRDYSGQSYTATIPVSLPSGVTITDVNMNFSGSYSFDDNSYPSVSLATPSGTLVPTPPECCGPWDIPTQGATQGYNSSMLSWFNLQNGTVTFTVASPTYGDGNGNIVVYDNPSLIITYLQPPSGGAQIIANPVGTAIAGQWTHLGVSVNIPDGNFTSATIIINGSPTYANGCNLSLGANWQIEAYGNATLLNDSGGTVGTITYVPGTGSGGPFSSNECAIQGNGFIVSGSPTNYGFNIPVYFNIAGQYTIWGNFNSNDSYYTANGTFFYFNLTSGWVNLGTVNITGGNVATPVISPGGGSYSTSQLVSISTSTSGATIYYTTNGSAPSPSNGTAYTAPFSVSSNMTVQAMASETGWISSGTAVAKFNFPNGNGNTGPPASPCTPNSSSPCSPTTSTPDGDSGNGLDPRRVGVRALASYWGASGEQIDMASGNLNLTIPLLKVVSRGSWSVPFVLNYNSQSWRQDSAGTWLLGQDVGYGFGWKLQAGSLVAVWAGSSIDHYLFTDATGAEYRLSVNTGGVWTSLEGVYISYDSNANRIYQTDGSFWYMGCESAPLEMDAGTLYPTVIEDANGNQILIAYQTGSGATTANTSARIVSIQDPRQGTNPASYNFTYNSDATPHLTGITNTIQTAEAYTFGYAEGQPLTSPLPAGTSMGTTVLLSTLTVNGLNISHSFGYASGSGELTSYTTPLGGNLGWAYRTFQYSGGIYMREVQTRTMAASFSNSWSLIRNDSADASLTYHGYTEVADNGAVSYKVYYNTSTVGLIVPIYYVESSATAYSLQKNFGFTQNSAGNLYENAVVTIQYSGTAASTTTTQTLDNYGNLVAQYVYDYGASSPTRTYNFTYLTGSTYAAQHIFNRLTSATVTTSAGTITLNSTNYDTTKCGTLQAAPGALPLHDLSYALNQTARGNPTEVTQMGSYTCTAYQISGIAYLAQDGNGNTVSIGTSSSTGYSLPSVLTPNGNTSFNVNVGYSSFFGVTSVTGPNGATSTTNYDSYGRPSSSVSSDGATTSYCYTYKANASTQTASLGSCSGTLTGQWKQTTLDGFGRPTTVLTGHDTTTMAETDTQYGACACSPLGKMVKQSLPYAYGGTPTWVTYTYDSSGRTLTSVKPDGSTTTYVYSGNTTTVTDPAGKWKTFTTDAFGDLISVTEPDPSSKTGGTVTTSYTYNGASQLTQVSMPRGSITQTRTFTWTGSDMASSTNPENGTVSYTYDGTHHVTQRTDAKGQKTQYTYDAYERLTQVTHVLANGTADPVQQVNYYYDSNPFYGSYSNIAPTNAVGRLAAVLFHNEASSAAAPAPQFGGTEQFIYNYAYNTAGRVTAQQLSVLPMSGYPVVLTATYSWDNQGRMTALNYPNSGPQETLSYDPMGHLSTISSNLCTNENGSGGCNSWSPSESVTASYTNIGQLSGWSMLNSTGSAFTGYGYNSLGQLNGIGFGTNLAYSNVQLSYTFPTGQNNGRISQFTDSGQAGTGEIVNYTYDSLNRLIAASTSNTTGPQWGEAYTYDGFGNLLSKVPTQGTAPQVYVPVNSATNQLAGSDANGNAGGASGGWDVENRMVYNGGADAAGSAITYTYDPYGKRMLQYAGGGGPSGVTTCLIYFYGVNGKRLGTYNCGYTSGQFVQTTATVNQYLGNKLIAAGGETNPLPVFTDRLGSVRYSGMGLAAGNLIAYYPYGEERTNTANNTDKFGTYFRDAYGQDYADHRYYSSTYGRFYSPDPGGISTADPMNPTSWNRYAYANDDPVNRIDPNGQDSCTAEDGSCEDEDPAESCWIDDSGNLVCKAEGTAKPGDDDDDDDDDDDTPTLTLVPAPPVAAPPAEVPVVGPIFRFVTWVFKKGITPVVSVPVIIILNPTPTASCDTLTCQGIMPGPGMPTITAGRKGERRRTAKPDKPRKHAWPSKTHPGRWEVRDPQDPGKRILKPPGWKPDGVE
jgi:RHS repeat-associated protein